MKRVKWSIPASLLWLLAIGQAQTPQLAPVVAKPISRTIVLPAELQPFRRVAMHAKVRSFVERMLVDRGSAVKEGQLMAELSAPELKAQIAEAGSKVQAAEAERRQAEAQAAGARSTYNGLKKAAETPGAIAGNEVVQAQQQVEAAEALVEARRQASLAAEAALRAQKDLESYLRITAPFDGMVTERLVDAGALAGPASDPVLLVVQEIARLRLVVAVPEENTGGIVRGARVAFRVPAYPERVYSGTVARLAHTLDPANRSMAVELDVFNRDGSLAPGMYPSVQWPVRRARPALFVPKTSVVSTTERTFVVRSRNGSAEWVDVVKGAAEGDSIEVSGNLRAGDMVVRRATDEIREGAPLSNPR